MSAARCKRPKFGKSPTDVSGLKGKGPVSLRRLLLIATWLAGTLLATAIVYEAVHIVAGQVTELRIAAVPQAGAGERIESPASPVSTPSVATSPTATTTGPPGTSPTSSPGGAQPSPTNPPTVGLGGDSRTFALVGGTASVTCSGNQITLNWATPNSGYQVEASSSNGGAQVEVRFRSDTHESRLEAWCAGGTVQSSIREESS